MDDYIQIVRDFLIIALCVCACGFLINGMVYFVIKNDESKIEKTRYCPSCGIDLVEGR